MTRDVSNARGTAIIEFAFVLPMILIMLLGTIDFGHLIQTRLVITNLSREGASIASRQAIIDPNLTNMLVAGSSPLNMAGVDGRIYITRITAGTDDQNPGPKIASQITRGGLIRGSAIAVGRSFVGLTEPIFNHLKYDPNNGTADIAEVTVVEVYYKYRPITPLPNFIAGILKSDGDGMIIGSKAVF
jgi:hypothetical protein